MIPIPSTVTNLIAIAGAAPAGNAASSGIVRSSVVALEGVPADFAALPFIQHLSDVLPVADILLGGAMLLFIMLVHGTGVRAVTTHVRKRAALAAAHPAGWRADLVVSGAVMLLLALHLVEIFVWAAGLVYSNLVPDWRVAGFFAGNTYTTVGYGNFVLATQWQMLAPIIAMSGLFTFGWTGSVLVDIVRRGNDIKDAAAAAKAAGGGG
jgi:hypothetical protein